MRRAFRRFMVALALLLLPAALAAGWAYRAYVVRDPGPEFTRDAILAIIAQESPVYYHDGATRIGVFFDLEHRKYIPYDRIPVDFVHAIVAAEDGGFFGHYGVSGKHLLRASLQNIRAGKVVAGGSTLTQQTAKNLFYRPDRSLRSKWVELVNALRLEEHFTKEDILEFYANQFHVSANGRGLGIAARYFFDKEVADLSVKECAFIAGMVKAPSRYNPFIGESETRRAAAVTAAEGRSSYVLRRMREDGYLTDAGYRAALAEPLGFRRGAFQYDRSVVLDEVQRRLEEPAFIALFERLGIDNPSTAGIQITTTIDARVQRGATWGLWHHLTEVGPILERTTASALALPERTPVPLDTGTPLDVHGFYAAKIVSASRSVAELDLGGRPCSVDTVAFDRIAAVVTRARTGDVRAAADDAARAQVAAALPVGTVVLASVREKATDGSFRCDLEIRPALQGAVVVLEDGQLRALVGGNDNRNFDRVSSARRQFGSTWKPIVYASALQLGWLPTDVLDNRRAVFPFRDVWYYPRPDHASDPWITMSMTGARSENLASVWLLYHLTDRLNAEQLRRLAQLVGVGRRTDETPEAWMTRLRDEEAITSSPDRFEEYAFTLAREDVLSGLAFGAHPEDAAVVRSLHHGRGFAAERARVLRTADSAERRARLAALDDDFLALEELVRECLAPGFDAEPAPVLSCGRAPPVDPTTEEILPAEEDLLVNGAIHVSTLRELRVALDRRTAELIGRDAWDPEVLALNPDFRVLVGLRYLTRLVAAFGVDSELPTVLSLPLGAADLTLLEAATVYQGFQRGEKWAFEGSGYEEGAVPGLRTAFGLPSAGGGAGLIELIRDAAGNVIYRSSPTPTRVSDPTSGALVGDILRNVVREGTGRRAVDAVTLRGRGVPVAGKTGTTNDYRNAAFLGFVPREASGEWTWGAGFTVGAYVGYDDNKSMRRGSFRVQGANGALPPWIATVQALADAGLCGAGGPAEYTHAPGLVTVPVLPGTGFARADGALGPETLTSATGSRRFAPFTETASVASGVAEPPTGPPPGVDAPGADLGPGDLEEGVEAPVGDPAPAPSPGGEPSVWDRL